MAIKHEMNAPHTPQQNGTAERWWRTGFDMTRCSLLQGEVSKHLWTYALRNSDYIRNRCFQQCINSTPYELFVGKRPNLSNLVTFGTPCFVYVEDKRKLDDRSTPGDFVGYDRESPAYLVYDKHSGTVRKSRNVKFDQSFQPVLNEETVPIVQNKMVSEPTTEGGDAQGDEQNMAHGVQNDIVAREVQNGDAHEVQNRNVNDENVPNRDAGEQRPRRIVNKPKYLDDYYVNNDDNISNVDTVDYCYKIINLLIKLFLKDMMRQWHQMMPQIGKMLCKMKLIH